jgi:hypothetical protein
MRCSLLMNTGIPDLSACFIQVSGQGNISGGIDLGGTEHAAWRRAAPSSSLNDKEPLVGEWTRSALGGTANPSAVPSPAMHQASAAKQLRE